MNLHGRVLAVVAMMGLATGFAYAQDAKQQEAAEQKQDDAAAAKIVTSADETPAEKLERSWKLLSDSVQDPKHFEVRQQALSALSSMGSNPRADKMIEDAMKDQMMDVRSAAVVAAGKTKSRLLQAPVRRMLDDSEPQVVFLAATTLWREYKDKSGEDVLDAVASGDRKANPTLMHGARLDMDRTMHSPGTMAKIGITTGAGLLLGPFGFAVTGVEYAQKNGADTARVQAISLLAEEKTPAIHDSMKDALTDKDPGVRAAAVEALGQFHRRADAATIAPLLDDPKLPVRLAASAGYINSMSGVAVRASK
jgi:HEAT repeat protein